MAKINARGAHEVARWEAFSTSPVGTTRWLFLLRSDGKLLTRLADNATGLMGNYSIAATFKPTTKNPANVAGADVLGLRISKCEQFMERRGYRVNRLTRR